MPIRMIIVDDEYEICTGLANYFPWKNLGYEVVKTYQDSLKAKEFLSQNHVDVVLTDIKMPGISGIELAEYIYNQHPDTFIVFLSGYADFSYAKKAIEFGVKYYAVKPTVYDELVDIFVKIKQSFDKRQQNKSDKMPLPADIRPYNTDASMAAGYYDKMIANIKAYINSNLCTVTLVSVSSHINLNPYYLSTFFKQHTGVKFMDYVREAKMKAAAKMLIDPDNRISDVSMKVGYKNPNNFCRAFKSYFNVSPREYRINENTNNNADAL